MEQCRGIIYCAIMKAVRIMVAEMIAGTLYLVKLQTVNDVLETCLLVVSLVSALIGLYFILTKKKRHE